MPEAVVAPPASVGMAGRCAALLVAVLGAGGRRGSAWNRWSGTRGNRRFLAAGGYVLYPQIGDRLDLRDVRFTISSRSSAPTSGVTSSGASTTITSSPPRTGPPEGLENRQGGACLTRAMRVTLRVGQRPANQTSPPPGPGPPPPQGRAGGGGGRGEGRAALLALAGAGGALWWRRRPRRPPKTPRGLPRPRPACPAPACPLRDLPPPTAPPAYYKV
ncbi:ephrin-B3-like [Harpia harpyja]|uniref:ephrin-B3-like n=1 Tax=Harpia harpyja TaxID=202280 RepID=UPI0022B0D2DA|nr:ephrin-B3-like [Harpia harpyja]